MKRVICQITYAIIQLGVTLSLAFSGIGYEHWQWWMVLLGIVFAYFAGLAQGGLD
jgi:hypothetical protein